MKLKRFLALVVSLAMVLSIVPAFSLTASAAETVVYTATATGHSGSASGGSLFVGCVGEAFDGSNERAPFINGTTSNKNTVLGSARIGAVEFQVDGSIDPNSVETAIMSLYLKSVNENLGDSWTLIAGYETANPTLSYATGNMNESAFAAVNNDYSNAAVFWTNERCSNTTYGWKTMDITRAVKNALTANAALATPNDKVTVVIRLQVPAAGVNLGDSGSEMPYLTVTTNDPNLVAVGDNLDAISLPLMTKADVELPSTVKGANADFAVTWTSDNAAVIDGNGKFTSPENVTTVTLTPSATVGSEVVYGKTQSVIAFPATYTAEDKIAADGASYNVGEKVDLSNVAWHTRMSTAESIYEVNGLAEETVNGVKVTTFPGLGGVGDLGDTTVNARTSIAVTAGQAYLLRFYYGGPALGAANANMYNKVFTTANAYVDEVAVDFVSGTADASITTVANQWTKVEEIFVPSEGANFLTFVYSWQTAGLKIADMELYKLVEDTGAVETVASVADVAPVKVIGDTKVVLPSTVKATGSLGSEIDAPVVWSAPESYGLGTTTVNGVATIKFGDQEATTKDITVDVTVLEEAFKIDNIVTSANQDRAKAEQKLFPVAISDEFSMEFTANYASFGDLFITIKTKDAGFFATEQIALGHNGDAFFRPVDGNGAGGRNTDPDRDIAPLETGVNYRFFITTDASTDKYSVTIFNEATGAVVAEVKDFGYRTNADAIEAIVSLTNNKLGSVTLTNIKVASATAAALKQEYTVVTVVDGVTESTETVKVISTDEIKAEEREGYMLTKTVDGNTVTFTYAKTSDVIIKLVDSADKSTEIANAITVKGVVGGTIDLTVNAPDSITFNDELYYKDETNAASYTVTGENDVVIITYTFDAITSFTAPAVTVIEGNDPILPATVTGVTDHGATEEISGAVWSGYTNLAAGTHTVNGTATVDGRKINGSVTVTVLKETFAFEDAESINGGDGNVLYFPMEIEDEFSVEFDYTINQIKDVSVQMGYNGNTYGNAALGISPNGNELKVTGGNKDGSAGIGHTLVKPVDVGETFRMFLTMDASDDTYTLTVTKPDGTTVTVSEQGFRQAQNAINTMTLRTNGGGADGDIRVSNIKIHSARIRKAKVTFNYTTSDGTVIGTVTQDSYTGNTVSIPAGTYEHDGTMYAVDAAEVFVASEEQVVTVNAAKLEEVTVNYVYENETLKTVSLYGATGAEVSNAAFKIAKGGKVYAAPEVTTTVAADLVVDAQVTLVSDAIAASKTEIYNATAGAVINYPESDDRNSALYNTDAMFSASWNDDRYGEMVFDVKTAANEDITTAILTLTPGDIAPTYPNEFNIYAVAPENYGQTVDYAALTVVGSGAFAANDVPVDITLDLTAFDASNGVMLIYKQTNGLAGVYGASFTEAPVLTYEIRENASATFNYVCEGEMVGSVTKEGYVGDTVTVEAGYYTAENGTKYFVDAASVVLVSGENTAQVNARKLETVTINYTLNGAVKKTVVLEGFTGEAKIADAVYVNVGGAAYWAEAKEYTIVAGNTENVELTPANNATFASTTETYNATTGKVIDYPEGADRNPALYGTDAMFSASWGDDRYGEILFKGVKTTGDDIITSAKLTLTPGDIMGGYTNTYTIYAANVETYGDTNNLTALPVVGSGAFTANDVPVTIDLDLSDYNAEDGVMLIYKVTGGLIGAYGATFGDNAPRLEYTMGEPGARVEVSNEFIIQYAKTLLPEFDSTNPPLPSTGYLEPTDLWDGFSVTESGVSRLDVYSESLNEPIVRVVSTSNADMKDKTEPSVVHTAGYGEGSEYVLFSFNPEIGTAMWSDIGLRDLDGKLITAFRINNVDVVALCPNWGHVGTASPYLDEFTSIDYSFDPAGDAKATLVSLVSQVDVLMRNFDPDSEVEGDEYYTVAYMVDGNVFTVGTYPGNFNGLKDVEMSCAGGNADEYNGIAAVKIYSGRDPRIVGSITANYIYNNAIVHSETKYYDKDALDAGEVAALTFDEFYYSELGSHLLYRVPAQTLSANTDIDVVQYHPTTGVVTTLIHNWSHDDLRPSDLYTNGETGKTYMIATRNLIPNGNFEYGLAGWYNGMLNEPSEIEFVPNHENGTVIIRANGTTISDYSLYNAWKLEKGETYLFTYSATGVSDTYAGITQTDAADVVSYDSTLSTKLVDGKNYVVFEADSDYLKLNIGWSMNAEVGSFGLYKLDVIEIGDIYRTIIEGSDPVLPKYVSTYEDGFVDRVVWREEDLNNLQIGENTVTGDLYTEIIFADEAMEDSEEDEEYIIDGDKVLLPVGETVTATVMVYPLSFTVEDMSSYNGQEDLTVNGGNKRFEQPVTGKFAVEMDVTVETYGDLWIILNDSAKTNDVSFFGADQILVSPSYFGGEIYPQDGNGNGTRKDLTQLAVAGRNKSYRFLIKGNCDDGTYSVTVITPEGVAKTVEGYGIRTLSDKIDSIAMLTNSDGTGKFSATNIKVYDVNPIDVQFALEKDSQEEKILGRENIGEYFYGEEVVLPEGKFYTSYYDAEKPAYEAESDNVAHIVETTNETTFKVVPAHTDDPYKVNVKIRKEHAVLYNTFATDDESQLNVAENLLLVGANGISDARDYDDDGNATFTLGATMNAPAIPLLTFNIPEYREGDVIVLNLYAYQANQNLGTGNSMKFAVKAADAKVDETEVYAPANFALTAEEDLIWSDKMLTATASVTDGRNLVAESTRRMAIDVTDLVVKAKAAGEQTITFAVYAPTAGAYIMDRDSTRYGAVHQGDYAAFLEVENDTCTINVMGANKVTKSGSKVQLVEDGNTTVYIRNKATMKLYSDIPEIVAFVDDDNTYVYKEEKVVKPAGSSTSVRPVTLGLAMVNGAQVRYGDKVDAEGKVGDGNGLRFITQFDNNETLASFVASMNEADTSINYASENFTMGVNVNADGSEETAVIAATKMQNADIYTSAITNLAVSNYNRNFTATPYIEVKDELNGDEVYVGNTPVTRSIYRVATGILETHDVAEDKCENDKDYSLENADLLNVLQAYVNQVGIRLTYNPKAENVFTAREDGSGAYTHLDGEEESAFFDVSYKDNGDGSYEVTIAPLNFNTPVEIKSWWKEYVRINNNNNQVKGMISDDSIADDGTLTFTFNVN